ncbi:unnamed protein product [Dracunculus medinensis]|uniref:Uncharacterized protein n=1 Tax=Dracunculus medinensis TaxID=318479 RepID=A0A0N4UL81_DRAME|nr:unnamed protein product [Dracunculus medinensis]
MVLYLFIFVISGQLNVVQSDTREIFDEKENDFTKKALPFSGGIYGKRQVHVPFSGGLYGKRKADSFGSKKSQMIPFSGGFYGKRAMLYDDFDDIYDSAIYDENFKRTLRSNNRVNLRSLPMSGGFYG